MVAMAATRTFLPMASLSFSNETSKSAFATSLNFKTNIRNPSKICSTSIKTRDDEVSSPSSSSSTSISFLKHLSNRNLLQSTILPILEANKSTEVDDGSSVLVDEFGTSSGKFVENGLVFRQNFTIRSYEIVADGRVSFEALMSHLQEVGLNHMKHAGLLGDGLGSTPEMTKRKLIWVTTKVQLVIDRYPTWGDDVMIDDTWIIAPGKNYMRRDSMIRDCKTGQVLIKASSNWVMMNKDTRKLSRIPEEVREEMKPYLSDAAPIIGEDTNKLKKIDEDTSDSIITGLKPRWSDLDINQHVNNAKYIGWVLESAPPAILENHEISRVTMEYRRECHRDDQLHSLTAVNGGIVRDFADLDNVECNHMLKLEGGAEVMKARTEWRSRHNLSLGSIQLQVEKSF